MNKINVNVIKMVSRIFLSWNGFFQFHLCYIARSHSSRKTFVIVIKFAESRFENYEVLLSLLKEIYSLFVLLWPRVVSGIMEHLREKLKSSPQFKTNLATLGISN